MNLTLTMMMTLVLFVLCPGLFEVTFASNRLRNITVLSGQCNRSFSANICRQMGGLLVTLYDQEDVKFIYSVTSDRPDVQTLWIGLHRKQDNITWSNDDPFIFSRSTVNITNGEQKCEGIENDRWQGFNCSDEKPFMCYKDNNYSLIENENKTWCRAREHCRRYFQDLVSINGEEQNQRVIKEGKNKTFWIGLMHDEWEWENDSCSTYREWKVNKNPSNCTALTLPCSITQRGCDFDSVPICSTGHVRIKVIELNHTWEQAVDYCEARHTGLLWIENQEDQNVVERWLQNLNVPGPFWIGLRQSVLFGFWIWKDRVVDYSNWKNDKPPERPLSNQCGVINGTDNYKWSDANCWLQLYFLCEEEIVFMDK